MNPRPSGYEPDELPDCSTPRRPNDSESLLGIDSNVKRMFDILTGCSGLFFLLYRLVIGTLCAERGPEG